MKRLLLLIAIFLAACGRSSDDGALLNQSKGDMEAALNKQKEMIDEIRTAETVDERISGLNKQASTNLVAIPEELAKSPASIRFVTLTVRQNQIAIEFKQLMSTNSEDIRLIENFDQNKADPSEVAEIISVLPRVCRFLASATPLQVEIKNIIEEKVLLAREPSVINELFVGKRNLIDGLKYMLDHQEGNLESDALTFKNLGCENRL
tara:strand:- start:80 stop:700 length:621 start_codon:yes stop_codon:yes gene_type:complete